jgi:light-regulated signal transduction histidine kinase (bacteriophytochrome)
MGPSAVAAPADVMRLLAHELRQPLSTIESIAYYLTLILPQDKKIHEQLDRIQMLVQQSNWMLTSGQFLSDPLKVTREPVQLADLMEHVDLTGIDAQIEEDLPVITADASLVRAMIDNLIGLVRQFPAPATFRAARGREVAVLEFASEVTGHGSEVSLGPGATMSIHGSRRVVEAHGGAFHIDVDARNGIAVRVMLT